MMRLQVMLDDLLLLLFCFLLKIGFSNKEIEAVYISILVAI